MEIPVDASNIYIEDTQTGEVLKPNEDAKFNVTLIKTIKQVPFSLVSYSDIAERSILTKAAIAPVTIGEKTAHFGIVENKDGTKRIFISPIEKA